MNTGSPPTAPNARTGELTPPGMIAQARWYKPRESGTWLSARPPRRRRRGTPGAAGRARRGHHIAVPAVPAQPGHGGEIVRLAVQVTGPPFVLVDGRAAGAGKKQGPVVRAERDRAHGCWRAADSLQGQQAGSGRDVEYVEHPPGGQDDARVRPLPPPPGHV